MLLSSCLIFCPFQPGVAHKEGVSVTIGNLAFCLALYLTGVHFRGELQHVGYVSEQKFKCQPIRTREIGGVYKKSNKSCLYKKRVNSLNIKK